MPSLMSASSSSVTPANIRIHTDEEAREDDDARSASASSTSSSSDSLMSIDAEEEEAAEAVVAELNTGEGQVRVGATVVRVLALLCACSLSIGSHYGSYFLGPLKSRLSREVGTSNTEFSLLIAAYNINNLWTPLVGGILTARLGTALTSIAATSLIFLGQALLLVGDLYGNVRLMVVGLFVFGLGISPLAVVQETIIVRFFSKHGLGVSLALGLVAGKFTSFVSAYSSYPLSQKYGPHAPFVVATVLAAISCGFNVVYLLSANWFTRGAGLAPEAADAQRQLDSLTSDDKNDHGAVRMRSEREALEIVAAKRRVRLGDLSRLGDVFWLYIGVNVLCGIIWSPFTHLAANIFEKRYRLSESEASEKASLLLAGSIILYPVCGFLTDRLKKGPVVHYLFALSSALTLFCYFWLALPWSQTGTPTPAVVSFALGHGFSTLLLVIIVPHLVPIQYVSTALGAHKSMESAGSTVSKILAGLLLDTKNKAAVSKLWASAAPASLNDHFSAILRPPIDNRHAIQWLLNSWLFMNVIQFLGTIALWKFDERRKRILAMSGGPSRSFTRTRSLSAAHVGDSRTPVRYTRILRSEDDPEHRGRRVLKDALPDVIAENPWRDVLARNGSALDDTPDSVKRLKSGPVGYSQHHEHHGDTSDTSTEESTLLSPTPGQSQRMYNLAPPSDRRFLVSSASANPYFDGYVTRSRRERRRGKVFMAMSVLLMLGTWVLFFATALGKINHQKS